MIRAAVVAFFALLVVSSVAAADPSKPVWPIQFQYPFGLNSVLPPLLNSYALPSSPSPFPSPSSTHTSRAEWKIEILVNFFFVFLPPPPTPLTTSPQDVDDALQLGSEGYAD